MRALVDDADEEEHARRRKSVVEHLQHRAVQGDMRVESPDRFGGRGDSEQDEAHVIDRGVRDQPFEVRLTVGRERAEDDGRDGQEGQRTRKIRRLCGVKRKHEAQETVRAQFEHHARQQHRASRGRFGVRVGQPGVERPDGDFDREGHHERPEDDRLHRLDGEAEQGARGGSPLFGNGDQVKGPEENAEQLDAEQESERSAHRINHELERSVVAVRAAPLVDQEIHRDEFHFPEEEEDQQVERHEDAQQARLEEEKEHHVGFDAVADAERGQDGQRGEQGGEQDHREGQSVHAEMQGRVDGRVPGVLLLELVADRVGLEADPQNDGERERDETGKQRRPADEFGLVLWEEENDQRRQGWEEEDQAQEMAVDEIHGCSPYAARK